MSRLERFIADLCPDGVKYVQLWSITTWDKRFNSVERNKQPKVISYPYLLASDLFKLKQTEGNVFLLSTGERTGWTTKELAADYLCDGEVVSIPWGKSRPVKEVLKYYKGEFVTADNRIVTSNDTSELLNKFLYYWMMSQGELIDTFYRGSGIQHPNMAAILNMRIPLPPLSVQAEVVRILDDFTELTSELTLELTLELASRKKQYKYYRDSLLLWGNNSSMLPLKTVVKKSCSGGTPTKGNSSYYVNGDVPWLRTQNVKFNEIYEIGSFITEEAVAKTSAKWIPSNCVIVAISGATAGRCAINKIPTTTNQHCLNLEIDDSKALYKYVFYCVCSQYEELLSRKQGARGDLNSSLVLGVDIPIPYPDNSVKSLSEQQRIVDILDRLDYLFNDISCCLSIEITARQKQYEYYRDKLLAFREAELGV